MHGPQLYSGWESFRVVGYVNIGENYTCSQGYKLGRRYTACGVFDGNGWLAVYGHSLTGGYAAQACFADQ